MHKKPLNKTLKILRLPHDTHLITCCLSWEPHQAQICPRRFIDTSSIVELGVPLVRVWEPQPGLSHMALLC